VFSHRRAWLFDRNFFLEQLLDPIPVLRIPDVHAPPVHADCVDRAAGFDQEVDGTVDAFVDMMRDALFAAKICSYAQGFALLRIASAEYGYDLDYGDIAKIWRGGCIIRAALLEDIRQAFDRDPDLKNLLMDPVFGQAVEDRQDAIRAVVTYAVANGIPVPALSAALAYFDAYRTARLPANMIQAQRDYFGAHTYRRVDREGSFHTEWVDMDEPPTS